MPRAPMCVCRAELRAFVAGRFIHPRLAPVGVWRAKLRAFVAGRFDYPWLAPVGLAGGFNHPRLAPMDLYQLNLTVFLDQTARQNIRIANAAVIERESSAGGIPKREITSVGYMLCLNADMP